MDRKELKIQALLEKLSNVVTTYENQIADFRVELTILEMEKNELQQQLNEVGNEGAGEPSVEEPA